MQAFPSSPESIQLFELSGLCQIFLEPLERVPLTAQEAREMSLSDIDLANPDSLVGEVPHHWFKELRKHDPLYWHEEKEGPGF